MQLNTGPSLFANILVTHSAFVIPCFPHFPYVLASCLSVLSFYQDMVSTTQSYISNLLQKVSHKQLDTFLPNVLYSKLLQ